MSAWYVGVLAFTAAERVVELVISTANARWSVARGAREVGRSHYPIMVVLHTGLLVGCLVEPRISETLLFPWVRVLAGAGVVGAQALRWWCIATLGRRWNTRVLVIPGAERVTSGPYRWLNHPNYVAVVVEGMVLPLLGGAVWTAAGFTVANAWLLRVRIRCEDDALKALSVGGVDGG